MDALTDSTTTVVAPSTPAWETSLQPAGCAHCHQAFLVEPARTGKPCPNCGQAPLVEQPALIRPLPPERILPFEQDPQAARQLLAAFIKPVWFRPADFSVERMLPRLVPVYWPMWLVDARVRGVWKAEVGFDYQVKSSLESYQDSRWVSNEVIETRIRWEPRVGQIQRQYENVAAPALIDHETQLEKTGPYRLDASLPFELAAINQAALHVPDLQPDNAWPVARDRIQASAAGDCRAAAAGQHIREFSLQADYEDRNWTQLLLPLYSTYYQDDNARVHPVFINGQTGKVYGLRTASQKTGLKWGALTLAAALAVFVLGLLLFGLGVVLPPAAVLGGLFVLLAAGLILAAAILALWPWQWNRSQSSMHKLRP